MTEENVNIKIGVETSSAQQNLGSTRKEMKQLTDQVKDLAAEIRKSGDPTGELTKRLNGLQNELGQLKDATDDAMARVKYMADDFAQVKTALQGVGAGIAVFQGMTAAAELFGIKNEKALEVIKKLQIAQAALNSVNTIAQVLNKDSYLMIGLKILKEKLLTKATDEQTAAQIRNNAAAAANPWGAVLTVIGLVIAAITALTGATDDNTAANKKNADSIDEQTKAMVRKQAQAKLDSVNDETRNRLYEKYYNILKDTTNKESERAAALKALNSLTGQNISDLEKGVGYYSEYNTKVQSQAKEIERLQKDIKGWSDEIARLEEETDQLNETDTKRASNRRRILDLENNIYAAESKLGDETLKLYQAQDVLDKKYQSVEKTGKNVVETNNKIAESQKNVLESAKEIGKDPIAEQAKNEKTITLNVAKEITEAKLANAEEYSQSYYDLQKDLAKNEYDLYINSLNNRLAEGLLLQDEYDELAREKREELANTFVAIQQEQADRQKEIDDQQQEDFKNKQAERIQTVTDTAGAIASIMSQLGSMVMTIQDEELANAEGNEAKQKEIKKKYAKTNAAIQIAQTIMTTIQSAVNAYNAMAGIPYVGPVLGAIAAAAAAAFGAVQIHSIEAQKQKILSARRGDFVIGKSHEQGGVSYELEGGEAVLNKRAMAIPEYRSLASAMNESTGGVRFPNTSPVSLGVNKQDIQNIVAETVAGITAIPVVVTEHSITETQARVAKIKEQSII